MISAYDVGPSLHVDSLRRHSPKPIFMNCEVFVFRISSGIVLGYQEKENYNFRLL